MRFILDPQIAYWTNSLSHDKVTLHSVLIKACNFKTVELILAIDMLVRVLFKYFQI